MTIVLNGGLREHPAALAQLAQVDGVMIGREACENPWMLAQVDSRYVYVWSAVVWKEPHRYRPGALVHRHRTHLVVAASDGFVQLTGWSSSAPGASRRA